MKKENAQQGAQSVSVSESEYSTTSIMEVFNNAQFGDLTVIVGDDKKPWFIGTEVSFKLGYQNVHDALARHCKRKKLSRDPRLSSSKYFGQRGIVLIPESDLYRLTMKSTLPEAETFQDWVCDEVLPSIREHGSYGLMLPKDFPSALEQMAQQYRQMQQQTEYIEQTKEDVEFAQAVSSSKSGVNLEVFGKAVGIGRNKLFAWLRKERILMSDPIPKYSKSHNMPYQHFIDSEYFTIKRRVFNTSHGRERSFTPLITGKGEVWLTRKLIKAGLIDSAVNNYPALPHQQ